MRVYIAAPWKHKDDAREASLTFEAAGHTITEKWWNHEDVGPMPYSDASKKELSRQALKDICGVADAHRFIFMNLAYSEGKCVELGWAISAGIPIVAVGEPGMNAFHYLDVIKWVPTLEDAVNALAD